MKLSAAANRVLERMRKADNFFLSAGDARSSRDAVSELQDVVLVCWGKSHGNEGYVLTTMGKSHDETSVMVEEQIDEHP